MAHIAFTPRFFIFVGLLLRKVIADRAISPVTAADVSPPSPDEGPPTATEDPSGYFPYVWCLAGTNTYVFIDPIGSYGFNKGTNQPIFATGLDGTWNATQNAMKARASLGMNLPTGDTSIDVSGEPYMTTLIPISDVPGVQLIELFAQDSNHQKLTYGIYASALAAIKDFVLSYPLYADTMYFQINDGKWGTVGNGYMGLSTQSENGTSTCTLKQGVSCSMPSKYPDN